MRKYNVRPLYVTAIVESRYDTLTILFNVSYETRNINSLLIVASILEKIHWVFGRICETDGKKKYTDEMWE